MVKNSLQRKNGFSILELLIASGLFGIIMLACYGIFSVNNVMWQNMNAKMIILGESIRGIESMKRELEASNSATVRLGNLLWSQTIDGISYAVIGRSITFQEPVDYDSDGDTLDSKNNIEWGAIDNLGVHHLNWYVEFRVDTVNNRLLRRVYDGNGTKQGADRVLASDVVILGSMYVSLPAPLFFVGYSRGGLENDCYDYPEGVSFRLICSRKIWPQFSGSSTVANAITTRVFFRD